MNKHSPITNSEQSRLLGISSLLKQVKVPPKEPHEWIALENELFSKLEQPLKESHTFTSPFPVFFLKPYFFAPALAALAFMCFSFFSLLSSRPISQLSHVVSIHGTVVATSLTTNKSDTLSQISQCNNLANHGKNFSFATLAGSSFIMQLDSGSAFELSPNSKVVIKNISQKRMDFNLKKGSMLVKVSKRAKNQAFLIATSSALCTVVGTIFKVDAFDDGKQTELSVYQGKVAFTSGCAKSNQTIYVASGQTCRERNNLFGEVRALSEQEMPLKNISSLQLLFDCKNSPQASFGILDISAQPDQAVVLIDDTLVGKTPLLIRSAVGKHTITIAANGYASLHKLMTIAKDSTSSLTEILQKALDSKVETSAIPCKTIRRYAPAVVKPESTLVAVPDYVEAMVQLTIGEYQKAIGILDSLKNTQAIDMKSRMSIMRKINASYTKLGNFSEVLKRLELSHSKTLDPEATEAILWETANIKANCLGDYAGAEGALVELLVVNPLGRRAGDAYEKLAEVQYMLGKFEDATSTYKTYLQKFPNAPDYDKSLFSLADIIDNELHGYKEALSLYTKIINDHPHSTFIDAALFSRAQCFIKLGRNAEAHRDLKKYLTLSPQGIWSSACAEKLREIR